MQCECKLGVLMGQLGPKEPLPRVLTNLKIGPKICVPLLDDRSFFFGRSMRFSFDRFSKVVNTTFEFAMLAFLKLEFLFDPSLLFSQFCLS